MRKPSTADARAVVIMAANRFETRPFKINRTGPNFAALQAAEKRGWVWITGDKASVTTDGLRAVAEYRGNRE